MKISNQDFFEVVEIESNKTVQFSSAREVSLFFIGLQTVFFKIFKNNKEVNVDGISRKHLKSFLQYAK